jgi:hypothetical protein
MLLQPWKPFARSADSVSMNLPASWYCGWKLTDRLILRGSAAAVKAERSFERLVVMLMGQ